MQLLASICVLASIICMPKYELYANGRLEAVQFKTITDPNIFLPVRLKCPGDHAGIFELISQNIVAQSERIRIEFRNNRPVFLDISGAEEGSKFEIIADFDIDQTSEPSERDALNEILEQLHNIIIICNGSEAERSNYEAVLRANRANLKFSYAKDGVNDQN